jgi:mevalonate kinase
MTHACAPGKIILFGEHAVVYGQPALAVPVTQVQACVDIEASVNTGILIHAPNIDLHSRLDDLSPAHPLRNIIEKVFSTLNPPAPPGGIEITIDSTIPIAGGLGSGAAVSVALIRALAAFLAHPLTDEQVNAIAYEAEKLHHGTPSGIDNTVIAYARPVYYVKGRPMQTFRTARPFTIVIGDTGIPAPTRESVAAVRKLWEADKAKWEKVFERVGEIVQKARNAIESGETKELGALMNQNHALLQTLTVSSAELDRLVSTAIRAGAEGAKLSGGGRGGNMIAFVQREKAEAVADQLKRAGARRTFITQVE